MKTYTLNVTRNGQTDALLIQEGAAALVQTEPDTLYLVVDSEGKAVDGSVLQWMENDLWVYLDGVQDDTPDLVLKDYRINYPIENSRYLQDAGATFATAADEASHAQIAVAVAEEVGIAGWTTGSQLWAAAALAAGAAVVGIAAAGGNSDNHNDQQPKDKTEPKPPKQQEERPSEKDKDQAADSESQDKTEPKPPKQQEERPSEKDKDQAADSESQDKTEPTPPKQQEEQPSEKDKNQAADSDAQDKTESTPPKQQEERPSEKDKDQAADSESQDKTEPTPPKQQEERPSEKDKNQAADSDAQDKTESTPPKQQEERPSEKDKDQAADSDSQDKTEPTPPKQQEEQQPEKDKDQVADPDTQDKTEQNPPPKPEIILNPVSENNVINSESVKAEQGLVLSGRLNVDPALVSPSVSVAVGGRVYAAEISGDTWKVKLDNGVLADIQGEQKISISVTAQDADGNPHTATVEQTYTIDTQIATPVIDIHKVAQDDIINLVESQAASITVTGTVENAQNGDEIILKVGEALYRGIVTDGTFSVPVHTRTLVNHGKISAELTTRDAALNSATGTAERSYRVDTEYAPTISLNNIAGDNILNIEESKGKVTVSGQVSDVADGESVVVSCGCESCGNVKWVDILAKVRNGAFSVDFSGETLKKEGYNLIKASVSSQDDAGNTATVQTTRQYLTDLDAPDVKLSIEPIAGDDVLGKAERAHARQTVSGSFTGLKEGERIEELTVQVNGETYAAQVSGERYTAEVPTSVLVAGQEVRVSARVTDAAGNEAVAKANREYTVDALQPAIYLDPIAEDNYVNKAEFDTGTITLSGWVENLPDGVSVTLAARGNNVQATVSDGRFSATVPVSFLGLRNNATEAGYILSAYVDESEKNPFLVANQPYTIDLLNNTGITIDGITGDNVLDAEEMSQPTVTIRGRVTDGKVGSIVTVDVAKVTYTATVQEGGEYSIEAEIDRIFPQKDDGKYALKVSVDRVDQAGNRGDGKATASRIFIVDKTPPQGEIVFDKIGGDNVLNQSEIGQATITLSGKVNRLGEGDEIRSITVNVGGKQYPASITGAGFSVQVPAEILAANTSVSAQGMIRDAAGRSTSVAESTQTYELKTTLPTVSVTVESINGNQPVNAAQLPEQVSLTGRLVLGDTVAPETVKVTVEIDGKVYQARVSGNDWNLEVPATVLAHSEGRLNVNVQVDVADRYGNTASSSATKTFDVDTHLPEPTIMLNAIAENDALDIATQGDITLSGQVGGEFKAGDTVTLTVNNKQQQVSVNSQGAFSVAVAAAELTAAPVPVIRAAVTTSDNAGNTGSAHTARGYSVKKGDIQIQLDTITGDDLINVTEAGKDITISGKVSGAQAAQGQTVTLTVGKETLQAQVGEDLTFRTTVQGSKLLDNQGYTVFAAISGNGSGSASAARSYAVDGAAAAKIDITQVDNDFNLQVHQTEANTRLRGVIELAGDFAQGMNKERMRQITVDIGGKSYKAGVKRDLSFFLDIPTDELKSLNGEKLSFTVEADPRLYKVAKWADGSYRVQYINKNAPVQIKDITFDSPYIQKDSDGHHTVTGVGERTVNISGTVGGTAKAGDEISIDVGGKIYKTAVADNLTFKAQVAADDLAANGAHKVKASLHTADLSGKAVTVSDVENYASLKQVSDTFVNAHQPMQKAKVNSDHTSDGYNFPYFIEKIGSLYGRSYNIPFGGSSDKPAVIKYHFMTLDEIAALPVGFNHYIDRSTMTTYSSELQGIIRNAYKEISTVANIEFVEVGSRAEANTNFFMGNLKNGFESASAIAYSGGLIAWNSRHNYKGWGNEFLNYTALHEITHTFGMGHTSVGFTGDYAGEENIEFSNMSYKAYKNDNLFLDRGHLRPYDLAYMQYAYGVNRHTRTGNDIYTFKNYNMYSRDADRYIWDAGGVDTFDASEEKQGVNVNLTPGSWIYVGDTREKTFAVKSSQTYDMHEYFGFDKKQALYGFSGIKGSLDTYTEGQAFIGFGTQIENLIGSAHNDTLTGNKADNNIYGGAGADIINGGEGNDYLDGGAGADQLNGGTGNDTYVVDDTGDVVTEHANEGDADHVLSSLESYTLGNHLEHLTLIGTTAVTGQGNDADNTLTGNGLNNTLNGMTGNDRIIGGAGSDTLTGGDGRDTFVFDTALDGSVDTITDFTAGQDIIELKATIFDSLSTNTMDEWDQYVKYHKDTGYITYDKDGKGNADAIHFATLDKDLVIDHTSFQVV